MSSFCFATITSRGYVDQTAGLYLNLKQVHPEARLLVCALDDVGYDAFADMTDGPEVVRAADIWGAPFWRNMLARMNRPESAFASKSAIAVHALEQGADGVMVLDSDLLFLSPTPDLVEQCLQHDALVVSARHSLRNWRKSNMFGLFSAGIVGFSKTGLEAARIWKSMCFDETRALPADGLFNEQKYLDYLIGFYEVAIVRDWGINVSPTILRIVEPRQQDDGSWRSKNGEAIRIFHYSRSTDPDQPFAQMKSRLNAEGLAVVEGREAPAAPPPSKRAGANPTQGAGAGKLRRLLSPGRLYSSLGPKLAKWQRAAFTWHRVLTLKELSLAERYRQAFRAKPALKAELEQIAFDMQAGKQQ